MESYKPACSLIINLPNTYSLLYTDKTTSDGV